MVDYFCLPVNWKDQPRLPRLSIDTVLKSHRYHSECSSTLCAKYLNNQAFRTPLNTVPYYHLHFNVLKIITLREMFLIHYSISSKCVIMLMSFQSVS